MIETLPAKLIEYVNIAREPLPPISDPDDLLHLDSLGMIRFVAYLESDLGIRIEDDELYLENFSSLRSLANLLEQKKAAEAAA